MAYAARPVRFRCVVSLPRDAQLRQEKTPAAVSGAEAPASSQPMISEPFVEMTDIAFGTTDWSTVERTTHTGERGVAHWRTRHFGSIRVRMVEYSADYLADHWCSKGHILLCLEGILQTELADGRTFTLTRGMSYHVADNAEPHRSSSASGATLFIVD